ncbi:hypothetical protein AA958_27650 [Streptomyces sp. CNQ-509]|uniref:hypothetical protein n=1 Tax=unclassified Streptomyces TaxID=2593676 RepID=UPI00062E0545|nr:hypothetical protein [Streptomyces sp. CNQ-509]AKH85382.1 hypothetical protein AA958_27650 [Streptomyces sp. CNQ-509]
MTLLRVELDADRDRARRFDARVRRGEPFPKERQLVIDEAWAHGYTPTGKVTYRGIGQGQPATLKFDVEVDVST